MDYDLDRFVAAQAGMYDTALAELRDGAKRSHWMWFVFPQIAGLGHSAMTRRYAIESLTEARAYLAHPLLGPRLLDVTAALTDARENAVVILGAVDAMKLHSSMTLFAIAATDPAPFDTILARFFRNERDPATLAILDTHRKMAGIAAKQT